MENSSLHHINYIYFKCIIINCNNITVSVFFIKKKCIDEYCTCFKNIKNSKVFKLLTGIHTHKTKVLKSRTVHTIKVRITVGS